MANKTTSATILTGDLAYVKIKKGTATSVLLECYKVEISKKKDKVDITQFPYKYTNYLYINKPEITLNFESYSENEYLADSISNLEEVAKFDIEIYKDGKVAEIYEDMILTSYKDSLGAGEVEKYSMEFTKAS